MGGFYNFATIPKYIPKIMSAFPVTMQILLCSLFFGLLIGAVVAGASLSRHRPLQVAAKGYVSFMRGIPTLILIFLLYLGLPQVLMKCGISMQNVKTSSYIIACLALSTSANMAEMMRTAYLAVDKGQLEAAYSVGMKYSTAFFRIIFPQAFGIAIPTLGNNVILLFKETSLSFTVGVIDILGKGRAISSASYGTNRLEVYIACGLIFWVICFFLERCSKFAEKLYTRGRKRAAS